LKQKHTNTHACIYVLEVGGSGITRFNFFYLCSLGCLLSVQVEEYREEESEESNMGKERALKPEDIKGAIERLDN
jgi:hypothetical protein